MYQTSSWLCRCLFKSPLFLKLWSQPLCWHMKLGSAWWVIMCCSSLLLNGKLLPQSSQTKLRYLWVYKCLSRAVWVANFLSHNSQSTIPWSAWWWSLSSLIEPKRLYANFAPYGMSMFVLVSMQWCRVCSCFHRSCNFGGYISRFHI